MATNFSIEAMLTAAGQGVEHAVLMMNHHIITVQDPKPWRNGGLMMGSTITGSMLRQTWATKLTGRALYKRRLIVTVINYKPAWLEALREQ
ncbi:unnamed protein product [Clonostachys byssicola]|uniref:Uncharacterized protein n=1 Tax=Clonostachys byssicola TaxID=160290 RepID=A0A9N9UFN0_9HYPO|nr:unnamed protein product [Clonostachys byssicola]